jgi:hypothetical protein
MNKKVVTVVAILGMLSGSFPAYADLGDWFGGGWQIAVSAAAMSSNILPRIFWSSAASVELERINRGCMLCVTASPSRSGGQCTGWEPQTCGWACRGSSISQTTCNYMQYFYGTFY